MQSDSSQIEFPVFLSFLLPFLPFFLPRHVVDVVDFVSQASLTFQILERIMGPAYVLVHGKFGGNSGDIRILPLKLPF